MDIHKKIEEIREKPEDVRMNYVLLCVATSMFFLIIFWGFSIKSTLTSDKGDSAGSTSCENNSQTCKNPDTPTIKETLDPIKKMNELDTVSEEQSITDLENY
jgi:hypothetical protein